MRTDEPRDPLSDDPAKEAFSLPNVFASVPKKVVDKILALEFVDMVDLLPEQWQGEENQEGGCCSLKKPPRKKPITDILLWLECFSTLVAVLSTAYPEKTAHFMAYQQTIIQANKNFTGEAWATYDLCYRRRAANLRSLDWGVVDQDLYSKSFTGRARSVVRCKFCLSDAHVSDECVDAPVPGEPRKGGSSYHVSGKDLCMLFNKHLEMCADTPPVVLPIDARGVRGVTTQPLVVLESGHLLEGSGQGSEKGSPAEDSVHELICVYHNILYVSAAILHHCGVIAPLQGAVTVVIVLKIIKI